MIGPGVDAKSRVSGGSTCCSATRATASGGDLRPAFEMFPGRSLEVQSDYTALGPCMQNPSASQPRGLGSYHLYAKGTWR